MTKAELESMLSDAQGIIQRMSRDVERYRWVKQSATQMHLDELAEMDAAEWDAYIDKARNRQ